MVVCRPRPSSSSLRARTRRLALLGALLGVVGLTAAGHEPVATARAADAGAGWVLVGARDKLVVGPDVAAVYERAIAGELAIYRAVRPRKAKVSNRQFVDRGPRGTPRLSFTAQGPLRISVDIVTDFSMEPIACETPARARGTRVVFGLRDSEAKLVDFLDQFTLEICVVERSPDAIELHTRTFLRAGPEHRRGFVSMVLHPIVRAQTDELIRVLTRRVQRMAGAAAEPELAAG